MRTSIAALDAIAASEKKPAPHAMPNTAATQTTPPW